jgi:protein-disulfide isomerase
MVMSTVKVNPDDHVQGPANAPIVLIEYADYQCPYCGQAFYIIKNLQKKLGDKLQYVFRNFPLVSIHKFAYHASLAAEAAGIEGKFWEMHDTLFENQRHLNDTDLMNYAEQIGLNPKQFEKDLAGPEALKKVEEDVESGTKAGVEGTPYFFVNGKLYEGNWMTDDFLNYLESLV